MATIPILSTKLYIPASRQGHITRQHLIEQLNSSGHRKLTLISAPAGFGKTTVLSAWIETLERSVAWLSLDANDSDPTRFLVYLVAALQTLEPSVGESILEQIHAGQLTSPDTLLTVLLNDIDTTLPHFSLILDDYHTIDSTIVDGMLNFLVDHLPPQMHLVIATREDPQLPLARLRVRDQLTELRTADLRFTVQESAQFLESMTGISFSPKDIQALEARTEGWVAGLQMAALSLQGRSDTSAFIQAFTGSHRFVLDYLIEEVLERQPDHIQTFLLQTAILDRLNDGLCDAVTDQSNSQIILDSIERGNLFIISLDDERQWYRYHHLFADTLHVRLKNKYPDDVNTLHIRASDWYKDHDFPSEAIQHAFAGADLTRAADLLEWVLQDMDANYQSETWLRWVKQLPNTIISERPVLSLGYGWALLMSQGDVEGAEARLKDAEWWLELDPNEQSKSVSGELTVADENLFRSLPASIATARAYGYLIANQPKAGLESAQLALSLAGDTHEIQKQQAVSLIGIAHWATGDLKTAEKTISDLMVYMRSTGNIRDSTGIVFILTEIRLSLGTLKTALDACHYNLQYLDTHQIAPPMGTEDVYRSMSDIYCEWGETDKAEQVLRKAKQLALNPLPNWGYRFSVSEARYRQSLGEFEAAISLLDQAEQQYLSVPIPNTSPIHALKARIRLQQDDLTTAQAWAQSQGISLMDTVTYIDEFTYLVLAQLHIAQQTDLDDVLDLLERLLIDAEAHDREGSAIHILSLKALAHHAKQEPQTALETVTQALQYAQPNGYFQTFINLGKPMLGLLQLTEQHSIMPSMVKSLLDAFTKPAPKQKTNQQQLIDPLSDRELEVLHLLNTEMSGPEIAQELMVSLNTIRTHTKHIYNKLGVGNRRAAIRRADELNLL